MKFTVSVFKAFLRYAFLSLCNFTVCRHRTVLHKMQPYMGFPINSATWLYDVIYIACREHGYAHFIGWILAGHYNL